MKLIQRDLRIADSIRGIPDARIRIAQVSDGCPRLQRGTFSSILRISHILVADLRPVERHFHKVEGNKIVDKQVAI